jgi:DNA-binding response OmpR family regulator
LKILIVEDDERIYLPIKEDLENQNYLVDVAVDGEAGYKQASAEQYDLLLLDLLLPKMNGFEVCRTLRTDGYHGPILMLTARRSKQDKIEGLDSGADDYLIKPFDIDELGARIRALLRRSGSVLPPQLCWGKLIVNSSQCLASYADTPLELTPTEYRILVHFMRHPKQTFNRMQLIDSLWMFHESPSDSVVKVHIQTLRRKLEKAGAPRDMIETAYGFGYRLKQDVG